MKPFQDQQFQVSSVGKIYRRSMEMFAHHLEDENGNEIQLDDVGVDQPFFVIFMGVTGFTRTSATRIA